MSRLKSFLWQGKIGPAFWTLASIISLTINVILLVAVLILGEQVFALKNVLSQQLIGGLYDNFVLMDQARITASIQVEDSLPIAFDVPVSTTTTVRLVENTRVRGASVNLRTGGLTIKNAPTSIMLPAGTELPVELDFILPVQASIPVKLTVPVDIPLAQTELHTPFQGLQGVVAPYNNFLAGTPTSWQETRLCGSWAGWVCNLFFDE
jgi:hypothetical protein